MVAITDFISEDRVVCDNTVHSKKRVLELISEMLVKDEAGMIHAEVFDCLVNRERLGSTGLGHGVAIPHGRLKAVDQPIGIFLQLRDGVDYDAVDGQPVDLFCGLLVPEKSNDEHLKILAMLAEMFSDESFCEQLRAAKGRQELYQLLVNWQSVELGRTARPCA